MNSAIAVVEQRLRRAHWRWKCFRLLRASCIVGLALAGILVVWEAAIVCGLLVTRGPALSILRALLAAGACTWIFLSAVILSRKPVRPVLAAALERADRRLQDRLNTLVFLQSRNRPSSATQFVPRITEQASLLLRQKTAYPRFCLSSALAWSSGLVAVLLAPAWFNQQFQPWRLLRNAPALTARAGGSSDSLGEDVLNNSVEQNSPWGEIRVTDPGRDLKVTKVDVVPLRIEAAANQDLKSVSWTTSVNGGQESSHALPRPADPRSTSYQPMLYLDQLGLADWDVVTYYAKAETALSNSYASDIYFLEIRPFREDILKLPGGAGGQPYQTLSQLSSLIDRQQQVIRQTHQHVQRPPAQPNVRSAERNKLAGDEGDLSHAAEHLYADMAANLENKPIGAALDNLAKAHASLGDASDLLRKEVMTEAQEHERAALSQLVAARKIFQKAVTDNPGSFGPSKEEPQSPVADDSARKLNEMAEFRNEAKSAQEFVQQTLEKQKNLEQRAGSNGAAQGAPLAAEEGDLQTNLDNFAGQHPRAFEKSKPQSGRASQSLRDAARQLQAQASGTADATHQATRSLEQLQEAMQNQSTEQQLADAYRLKKIIDAQIQALGQQGPAAQGQTNGTSSELARAAADARAAVDELKKALEAPQAAGAFGPPLHLALNDTNKADLEQKLAKLREAQNAQEQTERARAARAGLEQLSQAFGASQPKSLQVARQTDSLQAQSPETAGQLARQSEPPGLVHLDPARLPAAYRERIEKYFQRLSENPSK